MPTPRIGLTLDHESGSDTQYSLMPWYAIRQNYCDVIAAAGGLPLPLPHNVELSDAYLEQIDGVLVTGGDFDVDPAMFGASTRHEKVMVKQQRTAFEAAMIQGCLKQNKPIYGICGGQQLLNVVLGGTLIQHIPDSVKDCLPHEQPNPRTEAGHHVDIKKNTLLHRIVGKTRIDVNSAHHQAVEAPGKDVIINALAEDGVIEGIEYTNHPFCLGVQWHPEYTITPADQDITNAFVAACKAQS